jgi:hypothetical protein
VSRVREVIERLVDAGTAVARSDGSVRTLYICDGLVMNGRPAAHHVAIDPHQQTRFGTCGLRFLNEAGVAGLVDHYPEESQIVLPRLVDEGRHFDLGVR